MDARGRKAQEHITGLYLITSNHLVPFDHTDGKTGNVIFIFGIKAGHFSGFTANKGTARFFAGAGHTANDVSNLLGIHLSRCNVIEKKERFRSLDKDIIDTHGDCILADGVMTVHEEGNLELGTHAISAGYKNRILVGTQGKKTSKTT